MLLKQENEIFFKNRLEYVEFEQIGQNMVFFYFSSVAQYMYTFWLDKKIDLKNQFTGHLGRG